MGYHRVYANKNTTLFKDNVGGVEINNGLINTGANPIAEIKNGSGNSVFVLGFNVDHLRSKLANFPYKCNLRIFDAGVVYEPALNPTAIDVLYFEEDFTEGDGYSFLQGKAVNGTANWINRTALDLWGDILSFGNMHNFTMQSANEDWTIDVKNLLDINLISNVDPKFGIRVAQEVKAKTNIRLVAGTIGDQITDIKLNGGTSIINTASPVVFTTDLATTTVALMNAINTYTSSIDFGAEIDPLDPTNLIITTYSNQGATINGSTLDVVGTITTASLPLTGGIDSAYVFETETTYNKFVYTRHTRTIFQPFLEFFIEDEVIDQRKNAYAGTNIELVLLNDTGSNFIGVVTGEVVNSEGIVVATPTILNPIAGQYKMLYNSNISDRGYFQDVWYIDGIKVAKTVFEIKSPNQILTETQDTNLFFYPTTSYLHQTIRKGDIVKFNLISEIRGKGAVLKSKYEFKIVTTSNFEIIPWTKVELYNNKMFFYVDTSFLYAELEYEVFVRLKEDKFIKTSSLTYKFRLKEDEPSILSTKNASPYSDRDHYLRK